MRDLVFRVPFLQIRHFHIRPCNHLFVSLDRQCKFWFSGALLCLLLFFHIFWKSHKFHRKLYLWADLKHKQKYFVYFQTTFTFYFAELFSFLVFLTLFSRFLLVLLWIILVKLRFLYPFEKLNSHFLRVNRVFVCWVCFIKFTTGHQ